MRVEQLLNCQISSWYPQYAGVASKTELIDLSPEFVDYLTADGIYLPDGSAALPKRVEPGDPEDSDDYQEWSEEDEEPQQGKLLASQEFPELVLQIDAAIAELGGAVLPKLNWSCPKDAAWLTTGNSLKCTNAEEVLLLLKASDRVAHDICHALDECEGSQGSSPVRYTLALRKWLHLRPGREFRCFVRGHDLIGVSQRHVGEHFPGLDAQRDTLLEQILEFFETHIENRFPDPDFTFDIYITSNGNARVRLVDFNPIGGTTSPLLFTWDELGYSAEREPSAAASSGQQGPSEEESCSSEGNGAHSSKASNGRQSANAEAAASASGAAAGLGGSQSSDVALIREERVATNTAPDAPGSSGVASVEEEAAFWRGSGGDDASGLRTAFREQEKYDEAVGSTGIEFRVVTEPNRVQPNMPTFGVPFDLVDNTEGGAYDELLQRLQQEQLH